ncbi:MAG: hypothetical protein R2804_07810 [Cyclobacteriaceae bacterium]
MELLAGGSFISLASLKLGMLSVHGLSREVFPDLNGNTKSARLAVTYVGWHTNTYTGVVHNFFLRVRYFIIGLFFIVSVNANSQLRQLNGTWVAIASDPIGKDFITEVQGLILSFNNDSVRIDSIYNLSNTIVPYRVKGKQILINEDKFASIERLDSENLVVVNKHIGRTVFRKVAQNAIDVHSIELTKGAWYLSSVSEVYPRRRITFNSDGPKPKNWCMIQTPGVNFKKQEIGNWNLRQVNSDVLLILGTTQFDKIIYQVVSATDSTLGLKNLLNPEINPMILEVSKQNKLRETTCSKLISKKWTTHEVVSLASPSDEPLQVGDSTFYPNSYIFLEDSVLIHKDELINKQVSLVFTSDNIFELYVNDRLFQKAVWTLSLDGEYIVLDKGLRPEDYIELVDTKEGSLILGKQDHFKETPDNIRTILYYELDLR